MIDWSPGQRSMPQPCVPTTMHERRDGVGAKSMPVFLAALDLESAGDPLAAQLTRQGGPR
jgi:hypothetical protein